MLTVTLAAQVVQVDVTVILMDQRDLTKTDPMAKPCRAAASLLQAPVAVIAELLALRLERRDARAKAPAPKVAMDTPLKVVTDTRPEVATPGCRDVTQVFADARKPRALAISGGCFYFCLLSLLFHFKLSWHLQS